jgi:CelD/BcsL family acetyltransferase involved in cellulose biosynthesis
MEQGWFRAYVLYLDGRPAAFQYGELYAGRFRLGRPGYDPGLAHLRIGQYVLLRLLDDLCRDDDARILDYGPGDAEYKRRFGSHSRREGSVVIYAPTFRAARINVLRTVLSGSVSLAKRAIGRGELFNRIKKGWRRRLQQPAAG